MKRYNFNSSHQKYGFTIVELLVVIAVIGILAAITILAYSGIQQRAVVSAMDNDLETSSKILKLDQVSLAGYPATVAAANNGGGLKASNGTTYQYTVNNSVSPQTFCLTATNGSTSYYITQDSAPTIGACPGDMYGGKVVITNYDTNPGFETNISGVSGPNGSTVSRDTSMSHSGTASLKVVMPASSGSGNVGASIFNGTIGTGLPANTVYQYSAWLYIPSSAVGMQVSIQGSYASRTSPSPYVNTRDTWARISGTFTTSASGTIAFYILNGSTTTAGMNIWIDDVMLTATSSLTNYADGNSTNWTWSGTTNNSTSSGPTP